MSASVDGLISGMNTTDVINQLLQAESQGKVRMQAQQTSATTDITALQAVNSAFASLASLAGDLAKPTSWSQFAATSTNTDVATASTSPGASSGSFAFHVDALARAAAQISSGSVAALSSIVATGPLTITKGSGSPVSIDVGDGSLASVVSAINASSSGVRAAAVQVGPGQLKLQLTSTTTGSDTAFTVGGTLNGLGTLNSLQAGQDARLTIGTGPNAYTITSASNAVTALPGVTIQVKQVGDASIDVNPDGSGLADKVQKVVDAVNAARASITSKSAYNQTTKVAGPLLGETTIQTMLDHLAEAVSGFSTTDNAGTAGISLNKDGTVAFDKAAFLTAFTADPTGITKLLTQGDAGTGAVQLQSATGKVSGGRFDVVMSAAASQSSVVGANVATLGAQTFQVQMGSVTASFAIVGGSDLATVAQGLNGAMATAGVSVAASVESGHLVLRSKDFGSNTAFSVQSTATDSGLVAATGGWEAATAGADVQGTINGVAATGIGQFLAGPSGTTSEGLTLKVTGSGSFTFQPGLLQRLSSLATQATNSSTGSINLLIQGKQSLVTSLTGAISNEDLRLQMKKDFWKKQFSEMEAALGTLRNQSSWLASQISKLQA